MKSKFQYILFLLIVLSCKSKQTYDDQIPIHDNFTLMSAHVEETRVINVWKPPTYKAHRDTLPVLYMPDGGIKEDFPHMANTIAKLIELNQIPPIILVGIENTKRGRDLTGFSDVATDEQYCPLSDGAKNFRAFISEELFLTIKERYGTAEKKGIIGESLAGLFVMETFLLNPELFDIYIAFDPSLWWNDHYLERNSKKILSDFPDKKIKLWFAGSAAEDISNHTNNLAKNIVSSLPDNLDWQYRDEPNEKHNTIFRATKEKALKWSMN